MSNDQENWSVDRKLCYSLPSCTCSRRAKPETNKETKYKNKESSNGFPS